MLRGRRFSGGQGTPSSLPLLQPTTFHKMTSIDIGLHGLLLLIVRVALYITAAFTESTNPRVVPLLTSILVGGLLTITQGSIWSESVQEITCRYFEYSSVFQPS